MTRQELGEFDNREFDRGRSPWIEATWLITQSLVFATMLPGSRWRCWLLRLFGATVGKGVVIKSGVRIKFPWRLEIGDHCWIGEFAWIDNLDAVSIGRDTCLSQGCYICTGSHDWQARGFSLVTRPVRIGSHAWVGAHASLAPGATLADGSILTMCSRLSGSTVEDGIYDGIPARWIKPRFKDQTTL